MDFVSRLEHVYHQMIAVKDNLLLRIRHMLPYGSRIRIPDIFSNCPDFLSRIRRVEGKTVNQALFPPAIPYVFHRRGLKIVDYSNIIVFSVIRLFVHAYPHRSPALLLQSSSDRPLHDRSGLVQPDLQDLCHTEGITRLQHIDFQSLKKHLKPCFNFRPGKWLCIQKSYRLRTVLMTPAPFQCIIVKRQQLSTLWTRPAQTPNMNHPDIQLLIITFQIDSFDCQSRLKTQKISIKFLILYDSNPLWSSFISPVTHKKAV